MLSIRIVAASAVVSAMTVGGAMAQTASNPVSGQPIQLLQLVRHADNTKMKSHARRTLKTKTASKRSGNRHKIAARARPIHVAEAGKASTVVAAPTTAWPELPPAPAPASTAPAAAAPAAAPPAPSELVVGGQTVHVVSPDDANEIDRAADAQTAPAPAAPPTPVVQVAAAAPAAVPPPAAPAASAAVPKSETATVAQVHEESHVGSASWIAQVLAALGGAVAAGSAAWFLMGSGPQRTYG